MSFLKTLVFCRTRANQVAPAREREIPSAAAVKAHFTQRLARAHHHVGEHFAERDGVGDLARLG